MERVLSCTRSTCTRRAAVACFTAVLVCAFLLLHAKTSLGGQAPSFLSRISSKDALVVAGPDGRIVYAKNEKKRLTPASTLKILTALVAVDKLGIDYRFKTEFYQDRDKNLKAKGYGDPLLISERWQDIAEALAPEVRRFRDLIVDDTYFARDIRVPGVNSSTNPYDAPVGALCANFNTVYFKLDNKGRIVSAEPQTPMTPLALERVRSLGTNAGRYTFSHAGSDTAQYSGELLKHFLEKRGAVVNGTVSAGVVDVRDKLVYTYHSVFTLEDILIKMFKFSNNFIANQLTIALGAYVHGPPGSLEKGAGVLSGYAKDTLKLADVEIVEGSGISRRNKLSALDMLAVLKRFAPYRRLLVRKERVLYKRGTLAGVRTRAGYIEGGTDGPHYFVIFMNSKGGDIESIMDDVSKNVE